MVAERRLLPDLRPQLRGLGRQRARRPAGDPLAAALPARPRRRLHLADAVLPLARRRPRLRRLGLRRRRPAVRHPRRLRRARRRGARARPPRHRRHRPEPHVRRAPVVPERDRGSEPSRPRAIHLPARARRRAAERLDLRLRRAGVDARRGQRRVVPPPLRARAAGPGLAQPGRPAGLRGRPAVLARPRHRRLPDRRRAGALQGAGPPRGARAGGADAVRRLAHRPAAARAARPLPALAHARRRVRGRADVRRRDRDREPGRARRVRPARRAAARVQLPLPARALGRRRAAARRSTARGRRSTRSAPRPRGCSRTTT